MGFDQPKPNKQRKAKERKQTLNNNTVHPAEDKGKKPSPPTILCFLQYSFTSSSTHSPILLRAAGSKYSAPPNSCMIVSNVPIRSLICVALASVSGHQRGALVELLQLRAESVDFFRKGVQSAANVFNDIGRLLVALGSFHCTVRARSDFVCKALNFRGHSASRLFTKAPQRLLALCDRLLRLHPFAGQ